MNFLLLTWGLCGGLLTHGLLANFRMMLLTPVLEEPVNTAQDILDRGMIPVTVEGGDYYLYLLQTSTNPVYQQLAQITVVPKDAEELNKILEEGVQSAGTHVYLTNDLWPDQAALGSWYYSKEKLEGKNPFHGGWIMNKKWPLKDKLNQHILLYNQVTNWFLSQLSLYYVPHKFSLNQILS